WFRDRRVGVTLARASWRPCRYRHSALPGRTKDRTRHVLVLELELAGPSAPLPRQVFAIRPATNQAWQPMGSAWVAGDPRTPRRLIVGLPSESAVALSRVPRPRPSLADYLLALPPPA